MAKGIAEIALGPMFIGTIFNIVLYGIMITQVYLYFNTYQKDKRWIKCLVVFLLFADTVNAVFDLVYVYQSLVVHFGDQEYLTRANWIFATDPAMTGIIAASVQFFFAWRVKVVTNSKIATAVVVLCSLISLLSAIGTSIAVGLIPMFTEFVKFEVIVILWLVSAAVADICITISLCYHLQQRKTGFSATDDIVNKIIKLTVQTGAVTAICATIDVIVFCVDNTGTHLIFNVPLSKLYTNSLMSSLNARGGWKFGGNANNESSTGGVITKRASQAVNLGSMTSGRPEVFVQVESHEMIDVDGKQGSNDLCPVAEFEREFTEESYDDKKDRSPDTLV
ncbi:hypothetical protein FIBSPDRAFT_1054207 [Athelia psychrophila]|uniref:DUF6534 domain-containing protein n=1 Tax=Athelia psychrophila TaxID=1759441 RepID=A0A167VPT4_9AGAM|nr:hypothetical protein FIBSPDRAFT_1054207 [Fibularhizoctonia sp. CBS 109695]